MIDRSVAQYKILAKLGEGGMGTVYRGVDTMLDRPVAIKVLHAHISRQPDVISRFRSEAALLAKLHDPNIATLYSFFREGDDFFMVMELVEGDTLANYIRNGGTRNIAEAVAITGRILSGLEHAHKLGILHRDIKPANILVTPEGGLKITDFGIARARGAERMTRDQRVVGTLEYVAPERIKGEEGDLRSDLYSVGVVLYEMLSGHLPFERNSDFELMRAHLEENPVPLRGFASAIPPDLEAFVTRSLAKRPEDRFASAREMRMALNAVNLDPALPPTRFDDAPPVLPETRSADLSAKQVGSKWFAKPAVRVGIVSVAALALLLVFVLLRGTKQPEQRALPEARQKSQISVPEAKPVPAVAATPATESIPTGPAADTSTQPLPTDTAAPPAGHTNQMDAAAAEEKQKQRAKRRAEALKALDQ